MARYQHKDVESILKLFELELSTLHCLSRVEKMKINKKPPAEGHPRSNTFVAQLYQACGSTTSRDDALVKADYDGSACGPPTNRMIADSRFQESPFC